MSNLIFRLHCPNCGNDISDADSICPHCGVNLDTPLEEAELEALAKPYLDKAQKAVETGRNLRGALSACNRALEYIPESAKAHNLRGLLLEGLGRPAEAIQAYQEALRLDPDFADAKENLAEAKADYEHDHPQAMDQDLHNKVDLSSLAQDYNPDLLQHESMECCFAKWNSLIALVSRILLIGIAYYVSTGPDASSKVLGWLGVLFFCYSSLSAAVGLLRPKIRVLIDSEGITDYRTRTVTMKWNEINKIWVSVVQNQKVLCVETASPEAGSAMSFPPVTISFRTLSPSLDTVIGFIRAKHPEKLV